MSVLKKYLLTALVAVLVLSSGVIFAESSCACETNPHPFSETNPHPFNETKNS